jgi:hypothetical protein
LASVVHVVTTQCFLRKSSEIATPDRCSLANNVAKLDGTASAWAAPLPLRTTRGGGVVASASTATVTGATSGVEVTDGTNPLQWISPPIDQDVTISGTVTFNLWMGESATTANAGAQCVVERISNLGTILSTVVNSEKAVEMPKASSIAAQNWTASPTSTAFKKGDRIRIRVAGNDAGGTMASGNTFLLDYAGTSAAADGDSYVTFNETFGFLTTDPATTTAYPTDTASDIPVGGATKKEMWLARGGGVATAVTNTAAGWNTAIIVTTVAAGATLNWYTRPLEAFLLQSPILVNLRGLESSLSANATLAGEIQVANTGGTVVTQYGLTNYPVELGTSEGAVAFYIAGPDVAVSSGQRIQLRVYLQTPSDVAMASGFTGTFFYAGAAGATGDSFVTFGQVLTNPLPTLVTPRGEP